MRAPLNAGTPPRRFGHDGCGTPSPALLARAGHGFARFLANGGPAGGEETSCATAPAIGSSPVLHDSAGRLEAALPLDHEIHQHLVKAVLAWDATAPAPPEADCQQIALQLTAAAHAVATEVRRLAARLPDRSGPRTLAEYIVDDVEHRLTAPLQGTAGCVQRRARLLRVLYERLHRLEAALLPAGTTKTASHPDATTEPQQLVTQPTGQPGQGEPK